MTQQGLVAPRSRPGSYKGSTPPPRGSPIGSTRPATTGLRVAERRGQSQHFSRTNTAHRGRRTRSAKYLLQPLRSPYESIRNESTSSSPGGKRRSNCLGGVVSRGKKKEDVRLMLPWWPGAKRPGHRLAAGVDTTTEAKIPPEPLELGADAFSANDDDTSEHVGHETSPARESFQAATRKEQLRFEDRHSPDRLKHPVELSKSDYTGRIGDADYPSLFDVPTPPVPIVDQYIHDDNLLYEAITKRGRTEALPVNNDERGMLGLEKAVDGWPNAGSLLQDVGPEALLFLDKDIDKLLSFFDEMGCVDGKVTLEEMIAGFRTIKREWASLKAEEAGRAVVQRLLRLMERAGMSLETWFAFMDSSQRGLGDGKLTPLELRIGFHRLAAHIAAIECCCRAHKCDLVPNYGLPPIGAASRPAKTTTARSRQRKGSGVIDALTTAVVAHGQQCSTPVPNNGVEAERMASERAAASRTTVLDVNAKGNSSGDNGVEKSSTQLALEGEGGLQGGDDMAGAGGEQQREETHQAVDLKNAGKAVSCREHAVEGMVRLGPRQHLLGLEDPNFTSKEIGQLMRFIDTNVNFDLDIEEVRQAIDRVQSTVPIPSPTREAGNLLDMLERYMHVTGARFTDLFFCIDRDGNGYIERHELRNIFEKLSREPARKKARAKLKAEHAQERARQKEERELQAKEAFHRLEMYKKAGVYAVLKRIEVWQARSGKRLSEAFHGGGGGDRDGKWGLDADELVAFMCHLDLDLSLGEAMLVLRHLDAGNNGCVEVQDVAAAVRTLRRDEGMIRAAQRCAGSRWRPPSQGENRPEDGFAAVDVAARDGTELGGLGGGGGGEEGWATGLGLEGFHSPAGLLLSDGPVVFRPPIDAITHGRASTAPATHGDMYDPINDHKSGAAANVSAMKSSRSDRRITPRKSAEPTLDWSPQVKSGVTGEACPPTRGTRGAGEPPEGLPTRSKGGSGGGGGSATRMTSFALPRPATSRCRTSGAYASLAYREETSERRSRGVGNSAAARTDAIDGSSLRLSPTGHRESFAGGARWWPGALNAVEDGARLNIFTGSVLDGRWLDSLDSRLSATIRATRR